MDIDYNKVRKELEVLETKQPTERNLRRQISLLTRLFQAEGVEVKGVTLEGEGAGNYSLERFREIPASQLQAAYSDLKMVYERFVPCRSTA